MRPISGYYLQAALDAALAVEHNEDNDMTQCDISFMSPALHTCQIPGLRPAWRCISGRLFLLHFTHFADEVGRGRPLCISD